MEAARILFSQKGISKTSISEIAQAAKVAKGTFYLYFKDKDELLEHLILQISRNIVTLAYEHAEQHRTDDFTENVIIFVDYNEVYSEGYHVQWSIADIAYRRPPSRNYIFLSDTYRDDSEYYILSPDEKTAYALKRQKEFAGEEKLKEALVSAWTIIRPDTDSILGM